MISSPSDAANAAAAAAIADRVDTRTDWRCCGMGYASICFTFGSSKWRDDCDSLMTDVGECNAAG